MVARMRRFSLRLLNVQRARTPAYGTHGVVWGAKRRVDQPRPGRRRFETRTDSLHRGKCLPVERFELHNFLAGTVIARFTLLRRAAPHRNSVS